MEITSVIKYEGDNRTFIWKHPKEDFNTNSKLIVHESQEALFFSDGQALDLFGPGKYTLETDNIPIIRHFINIPTGGVSPFHCEVYFINKAEQMAIPWGTDSKVQYIEPTYGFPLSIGAGGEMSLRVQDSRKLLVRLVGTEQYLTREKLVSFFRAFLMVRVKSYLAQFFKTSRISIFEIDGHLNELSDILKEKLTSDFAEYGILLVSFFVTRIVKPDGDSQYETFKELFFRQYADIADAKIRQQVGILNQQAETQKMIIESQGLAQKRQTEGYTYQQERGFDVAEKLAHNKGIGSYSTAGIGIGLMAGIGSTVKNNIGDVFSNSVASIASPNNSNGNETFCEECGAQLIPGMGYCDKCGHPVPQVKCCKKCGYIFERPGKFCPRCGAKRDN